MGNVAGDDAQRSVGDRVVVLDQLRLRAGLVDDWLARWRTDYLPRAIERELRLRGVWSGWAEDPEHRQLVVSWSVNRVGRYWAARWQATEDPAVAEFWAWTDSLVIERSRTVLEAMEVTA